MQYSAVNKQQYDNGMFYMKYNKNDVKSSPRDAKREFAAPPGSFGDSES